MNAGLISHKMTLHRIKAQLLQSIDIIIKYTK